jgi:hypothetical protein
MALSSTNLSRMQSRPVCRPGMLKATKLRSRGVVVVRAEEAAAAPAPAPTSTEKTGQNMKAVRDIEAIKKIIPHR